MSVDTVTLDFIIFSTKYELHTAADSYDSSLIGDEKFEKMSGLRWCLTIEEERENELRSIGGKQAQVGWGSQIRSYVMQPYQMVKDVRTEIESGNIAGVLDGDLDSFMEGFLRWRRANSDS